MYMYVCVCVCTCTMCMQIVVARGNMRLMTFLLITTAVSKWWPMYNVHNIHVVVINVLASAGVD